ncbi:MAG TPA: DUF3089 domain-containing protein [Burkholderiaceae bacterium]
MMVKLTIGKSWLVIAAWLFCLAARAAEPTGAAVGDDVYANPEAWLCRPGHDALCTVATEITSIAADNSQSVTTRKAATAPGIDCFYVYPTVSTEPTGNSSMSAAPEVQRAVAAQLAPFASVCRPFAPLYRQVTIAVLESRLTDNPVKGDTEMAYHDVSAAWQHYLREDNHGRGVVLIGHSQGSHVLARLIAEEIDGKPAQALLEAAIIPGLNFEVPAGQDVGGTFKHIPLCHDGKQRGCVISYVSFRAETPPPHGAHFGRTIHPGMEVACTDPTLLSGAPVDMALPAKTMTMDGADEWHPLYDTIRTPFFAVPGMVRVQCMHDAHGGYLAVSMTARDAADKRPSDIPGDLVVRGHMVYSWGLHLIDVNLLMGNLVAFVGRHERTLDAAK